MLRPEISGLVICAGVNVTQKEDVQGSQRRQEPFLNPELCLPLQGTSSINKVFQLG